jgi:hypothetical protein
MDVCQKYFDYEMWGGCGIPRIDLLGTVDDWRLLRRKAEGLKRFEPQPVTTSKSAELSNWLVALLPALDQFVSAAEGHPEIAFWGSVCNLYGETDRIGAPVTGWITVFYPYIKCGPSLAPATFDLWVTCFERAKSIGTEAALAKAVGGAKRWEVDVKGDGLITGGYFLTDFPSGISRVDVAMDWEDVGKHQDLLFCGGIFAIHQHPDGALEPRTGWAVVDVNGRGDS